MRTLILPGDHNLENLGDNVMLVVTARWLKELIAGLKVSVVTRVPERLAEVLPAAEPVIVGSLTRASGGMVDFLRRSVLMRRGVRWRRYRTWARQVFPALARSDGVVLSGQGIMTDAFAHEAVWRLEVLETAHRMGKPTALFSQGLGVVRDPRLSTAMRRVLPQMDLIVLRNNIDAERLRSEFGCPLSRLRTGGDDGLAYAGRTVNPERSRVIGISARLAEYAGVRDLSDDRWQRLVTELKSVAASLRAPLLPVPVEDCDLHSVVSSFILPDEPGDHIGLDDLILRVARCRLVVTGSYHSAVFALAMGIPTICLVFSEYYSAKFKGLEDLYHDGCLRYDARLSEPTQLGGLISSLWLRAPSLSADIASTSRKLVERNYSHYRAFSEILLDRESRPALTPSSGGPSSR